MLQNCCFALLFLLTTISTACAQAPDNSNDINWLIDVLELKEGSVVADIGAGEGEQTLAIARHIGPEGKIYSTELGSESVAELRNAVENAKTNNITVLEGHPKRTNLPEQCCDAIYLRRVYHHFNDPASMNKSLYQSLKAGGRLAVIDFEPRGTESEPSGRDAGGTHGVTNETVVEELKKAGFTLISSEQPTGRDIYVVMRKPAGN